MPLDLCGRRSGPRRSPPGTSTKAVALATEAGRLGGSGAADQRSLDIDRPDGPERDPRPRRWRARWEMARREIRETGNMREPLHGHPAWRGILRPPNLGARDERLERRQDVAST